MLRFGDMMRHSRRPSVYRQGHAGGPRPWLRQRAQFGGVRGLSELLHELDAPLPSVRESYPESDIASAQRSCDTIENSITPTRSIYGSSSTTRAFFLDTSYPYVCCTTAQHLEAGSMYNPAVATWSSREALAMFFLNTIEF
uniref:Uncharacterized protein n=1 Tax=Anopheles culicifacies TaxID=139723 RepID=A0A182M7W4_9DIPT